MVGADYIKLIWVPDTFFVNEKEARFHAATQVDLEKNLFSFFIRQFQSVQLSIFIAFQFIDRGENFFLQQTPSVAVLPKAGHREIFPQGAFGKERMH